MTRDEEVDRAYIHGYEQASREWFAVVREGRNDAGEPRGYISEIEMKRRVEAVRLVRVNRIEKRGQAVERKTS